MVWVTLRDFSEFKNGCVNRHHDESKVRGGFRVYLEAFPIIEGQRGHIKHPGGVHDSFLQKIFRSFFKY